MKKKERNSGRNQERIQKSVMQTGVEINMRENQLRDTSSVPI